MIPLHLRIAGFLSYRDPVELDFTGFELACISGPNGAGKSSLLDAITWALFGQARRRDEALINLQSDAAEVAFTFRYEDLEYRILRSLRRGKGGALELQVRQVAATDTITGPMSAAAWSPLTERTLRETQSRIEQVLRLDYDTFVNASFFLQGKADLFAQQTPAKRKDVLSNVLGLEIWETYKARSGDVRRRLEAQLSSADGRLGEIGAELAEAPQRRQRLLELESELSRLAATRKSQASALETVRAAHSALERQRLVLAEQSAALERLRADLTGLETRLADRQAARLAALEFTRRSADIESSHKSWRRTLAQLEKWDTAARAFHDREKGRGPLLQEIASDQARLDHERSLLRSRQEQLNQRAMSASALASELQQTAALLTQAEARIDARNALQLQHASTRESVAARTAENQALKQRMEEIKGRIERLRSASGASCPLCGQPLSEEHRVATLDALVREGTQYGDQYRLNNAAIRELGGAATEVETRLRDLVPAEKERIDHSRSLAQITERLEAHRLEVQDWDVTGSRRLEEVERCLEAGEFALQAKAKLVALDAELARLGYDAAAHDAARALEAGLRDVDDAHMRLQSARAALGPLENEIHNLESQIVERRTGIARQESDLQRAASELESAGLDLPDIAQTERLVFELQEQENNLNQQVGAARQKVAVLEDLRERSSELESTRQSLAANIGRHKVLESAFGKDGVPALLVEQALPEVESRANEILDRLSDGRMSVHFETQTAYRDRKREDLRETLDIKISDGAGKRDYELYSGGEAFRVNFAIRLALSQVLAGRKGARLQTLVIDEGFGSQDNQGRQRLIETINLVSHDFARILLISHLDELRDAFPTRIEVEKTERGSTLKVM